jgi:hypothetical protein
VGMANQLVQKDPKRRQVSLLRLREAHLDRKSPKFGFLLPNPFAVNLTRERPREKERERERKREIERERETERDRDRDRQRQTETERMSSEKV